MILAPLRGVTIKCFRETFAKEIVDAGFTEAVTPFIAANAGVDPLADRELALAACAARPPCQPPLLTPQFIGKDSAALRHCLERIRSAGYETADLNCGCPFPMVRNKGRGSGILRTPQTLRSMLEVGCEVMGPGKFSIKTRLGVEREDELFKLMPMINEFPLRHLTLHARTARQMYEGKCDWRAAERVVAVARMPVVLNGDLEFGAGSGGADQNPLPGGQTPADYMIGRAFIRALGARPDARELLDRYLSASQAELSGDRPVLGRLKELIAYWKELRAWRTRWNLIKICRSVDELRAVI